MDVEKVFDKFSTVLSEDEIEKLARKYGVEDERERKLLVVSFFWLMLLSAMKSGPRGGLANMVSFFTATSHLIYPEMPIIGLSRMAISKKLSNTNWMFYRGMYNKLLGHYIDLLDLNDRKFLSRFKDCFAVDGSIIRLNKTLENIFKSTCKSRAALKLNVKFSIVAPVTTKLQVTEGKRHDNKFRFITKAPNILYLFDLGYLSFKNFKKTMGAKSFFVSRLKKSCDPLIVTVTDQKWSHLVGKRLSQINRDLKGMTELDMKVQLSKSEKSPLKDYLRLVGLLHEGAWRFYVTNSFDVRFTPHVIYELYSKRWTIEIFFNDIKHVLKLEHIFSKTKNAIMVEIYSALIFYLLARIVIVIAAKKSDKEINDFSFKKSDENLDIFSRFT